MTTLYNLRDDGDQYRVSKFVDGNLESSYLMTATACQCPAGERPSCRHRQMFPDLLPICNTHFFLDYDRKAVVDFSGTPKSTYDAAESPPAVVIDEASTIPIAVWNTLPAKPWRRI